MSKNGWAVQELLAMKFPKSPSTKWVKHEFLEKDHFFSTKRKGARKKFFLSVCFPLDGLSFKHLPAPSSHSQREKIKKWGPSTQKFISVCK